MSAWSDPIELNVGDLVVYVGDTKYCDLQQRIIYRVVGRYPTGPSCDEGNVWTSPYVFTFKVAYDTYPSSMMMTQYREKGPENGAVTKHGSRGIRRLELLDLLQIRNDFDTFIKECALEQDG